MPRGASGHPAWSAGRRWSAPAHITATRFSYLLVHWSSLPSYRSASPRRPASRLLCVNNPFGPPPSPPAHSLWDAQPTHESMPWGTWTQAGAIAQYRILVLVFGQAAPVGLHWTAVAHGLPWRGRLPNAQHQPGGGEGARGSMVNRCTQSAVQGWGQRARQTCGSSWAQAPAVGTLPARILGPFDPCASVVPISSRAGRRTEDDRIAGTLELELRARQLVLSARRGTRVLDVKLPCTYGGPVPGRWAGSKSMRAPAILIQRWGPSSAPPSKSCGSLKQTMNWKRYALPRGWSQCA